MKDLEKLEFEMNNIDMHEVDELCSKLEDLLKDKSYNHYYYAYIATHKLFDAARILGKFSKENIERELNNLLDPCLQKNELIGSKVNIDIDNLKANYNEVLNYIDLISKILDKKKVNLCIAVLASFETYIVDVGFIKRATLNELKKFADTYYAKK